ncbi:MBL fold metallo-hydrolase [Ornithinimicrobium sp. INDO-MA30-4]|uniref:MBL fold metallo-hydrolase n=1 Tax=Ornithinimicrobium sp. INDO-MA30-4 TaxID=2908651 RepID=UPI002883245B|nr:MBL fold metallo-hydrolase [Ornithinimicrobium sp. INDO-MA30-4]
MSQPSAMTLDGTNTWILQDPGSNEAIVIDPGPLQEGHLQDVLSVIAERDARVGLIVLTHGHWDHAQSVGRFAGVDRSSGESRRPSASQP